MTQNAIPNPKRPRICHQTPTSFSNNAQHSIISLHFPHLYRPITLLTDQIFTKFKFTHAPIFNDNMSCQFQGSILSRSQTTAFSNSTHRPIFCHFYTCPTATYIPTLEAHNSASMSDMCLLQIWLSSPDISLCILLFSNFYLFLLLTHGFLKSLHFSSHS